MDRRYELYCTKDPYFYDRTDLDSPHVSIFEPLREEATPAGWERISAEGWIHLRPPGALIPRQGWKIHVSATLKNAERVTKEVRNYCVRYEITFKVVPDPVEWRNRNSKYAPRAASGKLATIYPSNHAQLHTVLAELGEILQGEAGPYILSDLRWGDGPLHVRYGAFQRLMTWDATGQSVLAIEDPQGKLVRDPRDPVFNPPEWAKLPSFLQPHLDRRNDLRLDGFPYEIVGALHYSNGGGVYEARDKRTAQRVVAKEGRPHAGIDLAGRDAVDRLRLERKILERLDGMLCVPQLLDYATVGEHEFLIEEFIEGQTLWHELLRRNPLIKTGPRPRQELTDYGRWAMALWERVTDAVHLMHDRGVVFGDLHMFNIFVIEQGDEVKLIDFEAGWFLEEGGRQVMANPGFAAPRGTKGTDVDEYALACLKLALFTPVTTLTRLDNGKAADLAHRIAEMFGVPWSWLESAVRMLSGTEPSVPVPGEADVIGSATSAIRASASPSREDRLFPGDINQFLEPSGGLSLAYGAAGVLWALQQIGSGSYSSGEQWLLKQTQQGQKDLPSGFYNGAHGIAYTLWELDHREAALDLLTTLTDRFDSDEPDNSLYSGLAGIGLSWLHFARLCGNDSFLRKAIRAGATIEERLGTIDSVPETSGGPHGYAGLMYGASGPALLFTALYEATGEAQYLDTAETALRQDLRRCTHDSDGGLHVNEGRRILPYLADGSAGIGLALHRFLAQYDVPDLRKSFDEIRHATTISFAIFPGLFRGLAGLILFNTHCGAATYASEQVRGLEWHATRWNGKTAFPGSQLLRLSMDLATGNSGVLLALAASQPGAETPVGLPLVTDYVNGYAERR
ncbi:Lanthionine synthetase C-like protein [Nonomuraea solani]|uniref:Lanthionine synthetase C-like protein n=1 Tax=Nonomuraea solani TaxID=1144553 RepID=A0A1H6EZR0_9ACTN|nr:class III lanthionine synthetase LanKC [Nonomuraea solani]SEH02355.1 Lanthionine synthetase C-like protein [Nonomuraea solani]